MGERLPDRGLAASQLFGRDVLVPNSGAVPVRHALQEPLQPYDEPVRRCVPQFARIQLDRFGVVDDADLDLWSHRADPA